MTLPETTQLPLEGIMAATPFERLCPASEAVVGFAVATASPRCRPAKHGEC